MYILGIYIYGNVCVFALYVPKTMTTTRGCGLIKIDELKWNCFRGAVVYIDVHLRLITAVSADEITLFAGKVGVCTRHVIFV